MPFDFDEYQYQDELQTTDEDDTALAVAYARGRGGVQYLLNNPDPIQLATGILSPNLGNEPMIAVQVPPANARSWVITFLSMRFGKQTGGAPVSDLVVPRDNQASGFAAFGVYCKLQYGTAEALEEVLFDYPWGGGTMQVSGAMVRVYGPNVLYSQANVVLPSVGAFISSKIAMAAPDQRALVTFTSPPQTVLSGGAVVFNAPRRASAYKLIRTGPAGAAAAGSLCAIEQDDYIPGTATPQAVEFDGSVSPDSPTNQYIDLHPLASAVTVTSAAVSGAMQVAIRWQLDIG